MTSWPCKNSKVLYFNSLSKIYWNFFCCLAEIFVELGNVNDARLLYWKLLKRNPENINYYTSLEKIIKPANKLEFYANLRKELPYSSTVKRLPLNIATGVSSYFEVWVLSFVVLLGDDFVRLLDEYLQPGFHKGIPPLFVNLKGLYANPAKVCRTHAHCIKGGLLCMYMWRCWIISMQATQPKYFESNDFMVLSLKYLSKHWRNALSLLTIYHKIRRSGSAAKTFTLEIFRLYGIIVNYCTVWQWLVIRLTCPDLCDPLIEYTLKNHPSSESRNRKDLKSWLSSIKLSCKLIKLLVKNYFLSYISLRCFFIFFNYRIWTCGEVKLICQIRSLDSD